MGFYFIDYLPLRNEKKMFFHIFWYLVVYKSNYTSNNKVKQRKKPSRARTCHLKTITPHFITYRRYCDVDHYVLLHFKEN